MYSSTAKDDTVQDIKSAASGARAKVADAAESAKESLRSTANKAGTKVRHFIDSASDEFSHATESVSTQIKEKPVQSSLVALGVGFLLGALLRR